MYMPLSDAFIKKMEIEYLKLLAGLLKDGKINRQIAKDSAKTYLTLLPFSSDEDIQTKIKTFVEKYPMLDKYQVIVMDAIEQIKTAQILEKMRTHLKNDNIEEAINLVDKK